MASICTMAWVYVSVQGVGFPSLMQREARCSWELTGYARNLDDGGVEVRPAEGGADGENSSPG